MQVALTPKQADALAKLIRTNAWSEVLITTAHSVDDNGDQAPVHGSATVAFKLNTYFVRTDGFTEVDS